MVLMISKRAMMLFLSTTTTLLMNNGAVAYDTKEEIQQMVSMYNILGHLYHLSYEIYPICVP